MPAPIYRIELDGKDITSRFAGRLNSLTLTDNRGFEADTLEVTLDDSDGLLDLPSRGVKLQAALGWEKGGPFDGLAEKGLFTIDEVAHEGQPDTIRLHASSADMRAGLTTKTEKSWHGHSLKNIVSSIAKAHGLKFRIGDKLAGKVVQHIDQTSESDAAFLTRIARDFDAIATVKQDTLLFIPMGEGTTASGAPLQPVTITRASGDSHRFQLAERDAYTAVKAYYQNHRAADKGEVIIDAEVMKAIESGQRSGKALKRLKASTDSMRVLRHTYATHENALRAAKAEWQKLQRGLASFNITLSIGRPDLFPEIPVTVQGFKPQIDATDWIITRATHTFANGGLTTTLELEIRTTEARE